MLRPVLAIVIAHLAASAAQAADWRFVYTGDEEASATFVDLHSILVGDGAIRTVSTYQVDRENDPDGTAATLIDLQVDCANRRMKIVRLVSYDERGAELQDYRGVRPWTGDFEADTQGAAMVAYVCSNGASDPDAESWGDQLPFEEMRQALRARRR